MQGQVDLYKAQLKLARTTSRRPGHQRVRHPARSARQQFDQEQAVVDEAMSRVDAAQRSMELNRLSYDFTRVVSPIDGQSSRYYITKGKPG